MKNKLARALVLIGSISITLMWFLTLWSGIYALIWPQLFDMTHPNLGSMDSQGAGVVMLWLNILLTFTIRDLNFQEVFEGENE